MSDCLLTYHFHQYVLFSWPCLNKQQYTTTLCYGTLDPTGRVQNDKCRTLEYQILRWYIVYILNYLCLSIKLYYIQFPILPITFGLSYAKTVLMLFEKKWLKGAHSHPVMPDWGTNPAKGLFFACFEYIRDSPTPRQSGITDLGTGQNVERSKLKMNPGKKPPDACFPQFRVCEIVSHLHE